MIFIIILGILILVIGHEFGHFIAAKLLKMRVEEFGIGLPPRVLGKKVGETRYSFNALPLGGFVKIYGENESKEEDKEAFLNKPFWQKIVVIFSGILANFLLGWFFFSFVFAVGMPKHLIVSQVIENSPAYNAGIQKGDMIEKITIGNVALSDPISAESFVNLVKNSLEKEVILEVLRNKEKQTLSLTKRDFYSEEMGYLGMGVGEIGISKEPFLIAVWHGLQEAIIWVELMFKALGMLISNLFYNQNVLSELTGPIGVVAFTSKAGSFGIIYIFQFLGLISINLAVINILPIPALDGGRFLFFLIEKIKGKKISFQLQNALIGISFLLLLILMIFVTLEDIKRFF